MRLRPMGSDDLPAVRTWFDDAETRRWLGAPDWADQALRLAAPAHGRHVLIGEVDGQPIGLLDLECYAGGEASFAVVTAPDHRRKGIGRQMIETVQAGLVVEGLRELFAGVEIGNEASAALLLRCGFALVRDADEDGFSYFAWRPNGQRIEAWRITG
jgi:RimJ/RimL family protein N-acetyltransferase